MRPTKEQIAAHEERGGRWMLLCRGQVVMRRYRVSGDAIIYEWRPFGSEGKTVPLSSGEENAGFWTDADWRPIDEAGNPIALLQEIEQLRGEVAALKSQIAKERSDATEAHAVLIRENQELRAKVKG